MTINKNSIENYQINIDNKINVDYKTKETKISFYRVIIENTQQESFFKKDLNTTFSQSLDLEPFEKNHEIVKPKFKLIQKNEDFAFLVYSNTKKFDDYMAKMHKDQEEIKDAYKYEFEYFLFAMFDLKNNNLVIINNKKATNWRDSFEQLFKIKGGFYSTIIPFQDNDIVKQLQKQKLKNITFSTISKEHISKNLPWKTCAEPDIIEKCSVTLKFKESLSSENEVFSFVDENYIKNKKHFSKLQIEAESGIVDIIKDTITKSITVSIPKTHESDSIQMENIRLVLENCLNTIKQ